MRRSHKNKRVFSFILFLSAGMFVVDTFLPLGIAFGIVYVPIVILASLLSKSRYIYIVACITTLLTILGYLLSPSVGVYYGIVTTNRLLSIMCIWFAAVFIYKNKLLAEQLQESKEKLDAIFNNASDGIIVCNEKGEIVMVSRMAEQIFGYTKQEILGNPVEILLPVDKREIHFKYREKYMTDLQIRPMGKANEIKAVHKDGTTFPIEVGLSYIKTYKELMVISFVKDITERKRAEDLIKEINDDLKNYSMLLKRSNTDLEQFAYIASHDLQEPLRKIQAFANRLKIESSELLNAKGKENIDKMINASERMQNLINDLLAYSKIATKSERFVAVNLNSIINETLYDMDVTIEKTKSIIKISQLPVIEMEPIQAKQLFQNLIGNAIKFCKEGTPPVISIKGKLIHKDGKEMAEIRLEDNGIGFEQKFAERIFNVFQRLEGRKYEGSGIGLSICKKIANHHNGDLKAESILGKGTVFIITLPLKQERV